MNQIGKTGLDEKFPLEANFPELETANYSETPNSSQAVGTSEQVQTESENVLQEAARITSSDRQSAYGPPEENHQRTADLWAAYLGVPITARQVCWMNVLQKASRDVYRPGRDNLVDGCGYLRNAERCEPGTVK